MKLKFRVFGMLLAAMLSIPLFSGCNNGNGTSSSGTSLPAGGVSLKWIVIGTQPNDLSDVMEQLNAYASKQIGVTCQMTYLDWGVWSDRVTAMLSGGEAFDLMFLNQDKYWSAVSLGAVADLTDLLPQAAPELYEFIPEMVWQGAEIAGKIYSVPTYKDSSQTQYWVWDKEIVDTLGIDYQQIESPAELDPALYQIQAAIDNGSLDIAGNRYALPSIRDGINGFLLRYDRPAAIDAIGVRYDDDTLRVVNIYEQEDIMDLLTHMHKWYGDGIINPDAPTVTEGQKWTPVSSGQGFPGSEANWSAGSGREMVAHVWGGPIYSNISIQGSLNAVSASSKYKEEALRWLQFVNLDSKARNMLAYGIEGVHYTDNGDGTITQDPVKKDDYAAPSYAQATYFTMSPVAPNRADQWELVQAWNEQAEASVLLGFSFDTSQVNNQIANCNVVLERYKAELYTGASDPSSAVPQLYLELEEAGLGTIREEMQAQIDAWAGK